MCLPVKIMHFLITVNCYNICNEEHYNCTIVRAHDASPHLHSITINDSKQTILYADTWDRLLDSTTLSHVAINSVVGVKLSEDGNNSCS